MGWPHVPADWVSSFTPGAHSAPTVEVRALDEGVGWSVITDNAELKSCDVLETKIDYFSFGGTTKAKDIRIKFVDDDGAGNRGAWFDSSSNIAAGWPILVRITYDTTYRTVFSGRIMRIEQGDDASATLICKEWLSWWLDDHALDSYWAYTPDRYLTKTPHANADELRGGGSCFLSDTTTDTERLTGLVTSYGDNWPATYHIWADRGIPEAWLNSGQITSRGQEAVDELGGSKTYFSDWSHALTIHTRPKSFYTNDWLHDRGTKGVNWVGGANVVAHSGTDYENQSNQDRTIFSLSPPFFSYGASTQAFTLKNFDGATLTEGGLGYIGPDIETWRKGKVGETEFADGGKDFTWASWHNNGTGMSEFAVYRRHGTDTQDGLKPHDKWNTPRYDYKDERNCPMFGDARETWYNQAPGTQDDPWAYACFSPPQSDMTGNSDLKIPDSDRQTETRRSGFVDTAFAILDVLGGYTRPPAPEIDGPTEYDLQDGFTSTALETHGYTQATSSGGSSPLRSDVTADYLEDGSRIPALNFGLLNQKIGLADNVMQPGTKYRKLLDEICKAVGVWIFQSPFGQIDFQLARPLGDSAGGDFYESAVTVPTFRASTSGDEPNIDQDSSDRNAWKIKWTDHGEKTVKSCSVEWNVITRPTHGLTVVESQKTPVSTGVGGYTASGEKEVTHKVNAVTSNQDVIRSNYLKAYGEPLTGVSFDTALPFFSDDRDRSTGSNTFLRLGRPIDVQDTNHGRGGDAIITGMRLDVCAGTMGLSAITGDSRAVDEHCWPEAELVDFGQTGVGNYTEKTITFTNDGLAAISGTVTLAAPGDFAIQSGDTYTSLAVGASHDVVVRFTPIEIGAYIARLDSGGDASAGTGCINSGVEVTVDMIASAFALPICLSKGEIDFGEFYINYSLDKTIDIWNYGTGTLDGYVEFPAEDGYANFRLVDDSNREFGSPSTTDIELGRLAGGENKEVTVRFRPTAEGDFEARLNLNADVRCFCGTDIDTITLKGKGIPIPDCFVTNQAMNFGNISAGASSSAQQFTLSNTSNDTLTGTIQIMQSASDPVFDWDSTPWTRGTALPDDPPDPVEAGNDANGVMTYNWEIGKDENTLNFFVVASPAATSANGIRNCIVEVGGRDCKSPYGIVKVNAQDEGCTVSDLSLVFATVEANTGPPETQTVSLTNPTGETIGGTCSVNSTRSGFSITDGTPTGTSTATDNLDGTWDWQILTTESIEWEITFDPSEVGTDSGAITWGEDETDSNCYTTGVIGKAIPQMWAYPDRIDFGNVSSNLEPTLTFTVENLGYENAENLEIKPYVDNGVGSWGVINPSTGAKVPFSSGGSNYYTVLDFFEGPNAHTVTVYWDPDDEEGSWGGLSTLRLYRDATNYETVVMDGVSYNPTGCHIATSTALGDVLNRFNVGDQLISTNSATQSIRVYNLNESPLDLYPTLNSVGSNWVRVSGHALNTTHAVTQNNYIEIGVQLQLGASDRGVQLGKMSFGENCGDTVTLFGKGVSPRDIFDINPSGLLFSVASNSTQQLTATIYNTSETLTLSTTASLAGAAATYFSFISGGGAITVGPGEEHSITIQCNPDGVFYIGWAFCDFDGHLDGVHIPMSADISDATSAANLEVSNTLFAGILSTEDNVQDAFDTLDDHTIQDHSDGGTVLLKDGTVAMTGNLDLAGNDIATDDNLEIDMSAAALTKTLQVKNSGTSGIANMTVQDDLTVGDNISVGGTVDGVNIASHAANSDAHHNESHTVASHSDTTATGAELETLTDGSDADALHIHAKRDTLLFGQRNTGGSDYWDLAGLVSGNAGYRAYSMEGSGSIVRFSFTLNMSAVTSSGDFECEIYAGPLAASATMIKEEVVAISAAGYIQVTQTYAPGTYTFNADDMIALFGRLASGLAGTWNNGTAKVTVEYD